MPMRESLHAYCRRVGVICRSDPQLLPYSENSWRLIDTSGREWVAKPNEPGDRCVEMLQGFTMLHPHFRHPHPLSKPDDPYVLYPYIQGQVLADGPFDTPDMVETVFEVIGRFRAMMRSLNLLPFLEEKLKQSNPIGDAASWDSGGARRAVSRSEAVKLMPTRLQIAGSFHWARKETDLAIHAVTSLGLWPRAPFEAFKEQLERRLSIHIPVVGNNLSHTAMHPEHILLCEDGAIGLVGWHIKPRPRFHMNQSYLAWALLRSGKPAMLACCREALSREKTRDFHKDHQLVFALCLLEQTARATRPASNLKDGPLSQGIALAEACFSECVESLAG